MAAAEGIYTRISVLGDKEYKKALSDIGRQLTVLNTGMKASQSAFEGQEDSMEALQPKRALNALLSTRASPAATIRKQPSFSLL